MWRGHIMFRCVFQPLQYKLRILKSWSCLNLVTKVHIQCEIWGSLVEQTADVGTQNTFCCMKASNRWINWFIVLCTCCHLLELLHLIVLPITICRWHTGNLVYVEPCILIGMKLNDQTKWKCSILTPQIRINGLNVNEISFRFTWGDSFCKSNQLSCICFNRNSQTTLSWCTLCLMINA